MTHKPSKSAGTFISALVVLVMAGATPVLAQVAMEEIVVTARKKAENPQDIPLVITVFSADTLERKGVDNIEDIARLTAGVIVDQGTFPQDIRVVISGLSPTRGRPNVAFLLDGVDVTSESVQSAGGSLLINPRLFDLEFFPPPFTFILTNALHATLPNKRLHCVEYASGKRQAGVRVSYNF